MSCSFVPCIPNTKGRSNNATKPTEKLVKWLFHKLILNHHIVIYNKLKISLPPRQIKIGKSLKIQVFVMQKYKYNLTRERARASNPGIPFYVLFADWNEPRLDICLCFLVLGTPETWVLRYMYVTCIYLSFSRRNWFIRVW